MKRNAIKHLCELYYRKKNRRQTWFNSVSKCLCRALINIRMFLKCQTIGRLRGQMLNAPALDLHSLPSPLRDVPGLNTALTSGSRGYSMQSPRRHYHCYFHYVFCLCLLYFKIFNVSYSFSFFFLYIHLISHLLFSIFSAILIPIEAKKCNSAFLFFTKF